MALPKYSLAFKYHMRLVIYFYIVLGLFKLFEGLTHGVHSNSAWKRETKVKGTSQ